MSNNKSSPYQAYLYDLGLLIKEMSLNAKSDVASLDNRDYNLGRLMAFHEVVSLMQQQAEAFGITLTDIGLSDIDPEKHLL